MAEIFCGVLSEKEVSPQCESNSRVARRRRMEIRRFKFVASAVAAADLDSCKSQKVEAPLLQREGENAAENRAVVETKVNDGGGVGVSEEKPNLSYGSARNRMKLSDLDKSNPKFGVTSVCGRRRDMEDAVSIHPSLFGGERQISPRFHFFGVFDGHGCSHVAMSCKERLHSLVAEEFVNPEASIDWRKGMEQSFSRMDAEVSACGRNGRLAPSCRCELQTPQCDAVGSTAVVAVLGSDKIIVANCGDSRALLCRNGRPLPLSSDHKPDRPDELERIQAAGGRVIYWDGPRVNGVLAMSRAIGDSYLKPFVSSEPEVRVMERRAEDEFLILASDGLWDVVSNETACDIVRMCLRRGQHGHEVGAGGDEADEEGSDRACSDASMLLTKLALARQSADNVSVLVVDLSKDG